MENLIFMITPSSASVAENQVLPLTTIARRTGRAIRSENNSILLRFAGYYKVNASITFTAQEAGDAEIKLQKNSVDVPAIIAATTVTTADTSTKTLNLSGIVRVMPVDTMATLTLLNSGVAIDTTNIGIDVEYLG